MASLTGVLKTVSGKFTGVFISFKSYISRDQQRVPASRKDNLVFIVFSLHSFLQIKSQGNPKDSPFLTHPKSCNIAIASLLLYGLAYDVEQRFSSTWPSYPKLMASLTGVLKTVSGKFTGVFISFKSYISRDQQRVPASRKDNLVFIVFSLLSFLQIKSQGNPKDSPFLTHPKSCNIAIASLLLYGLAYDVEQRFSSTWPSYPNAARRVMGLLGSLLMASLASILFPGWMLPVLYVVYICFYADELIEWILRRYIDESDEETDTSLV